MVMVLRSVAPDWEVRDSDGNVDKSKMAKCVNFRPTRDRDEFFGDASEESKALYGPADESEARKICNGDDDGIVCPMREDCLFFALLNNEHYGTWGGLSVDQRHYIRRNHPRENWQWALAPALLPDGSLDLNDDGVPNQLVGLPSAPPPRNFPAFS